MPEVNFFLFLRVLLVGWLVVCCWFLFWCVTIIVMGRPNYKSVYLSGIVNTNSECPDNCVIEEIKLKCIDSCLLLKGSRRGGAR